MFCFCETVYFQLYNYRMLLLSRTTFQCFEQFVNTKAIKYNFRLIQSHGSIKKLNIKLNSFVELLFKDLKSQKEDFSLEI